MLIIKPETLGSLTLAFNMKHTCNSLTGDALLQKIQYRRLLQCSDNKKYRSTINNIDKKT